MSDFVVRLVCWTLATIGLITALMLLILGAMREGVIGLVASALWFVEGYRRGARRSRRGER